MIKWAARRPRLRNIFDSVVQTFADCPQARIDSRDSRDVLRGRLASSSITGISDLELPAAEPTVGSGVFLACMRMR